MDQNILLTFHYNMLKPFPKTNTGVEFQAILNANIDWE